MGTDDTSVYQGKSLDQGGTFYGTWEPQPDNSLRILAQDDTSISRVSIRPSPSTGMASDFGH